MENYIEYNSINTIPIKYPIDRVLRLPFYPRYKIIDSEKLLKCFQKTNTFIKIYDNIFRYIRVDLKHFFKTVNIEALFYYILVEKTFDYDLEINNDFLNKLFVNNNYILITTPVLRYGNIYYNITNNNDLQFLYHTNDMILNDAQFIYYLVEYNCYSVADNMNILISLFHKNYISKHIFMYFTSFINDKKHEQFTKPVWLQLLNSNKIKDSACDFYIIYLIQNMEYIDNDIFKIYDKIFKNTYNIPLYIRDDLFFITYCSCIYPKVNKYALYNVYGNCMNDIYMTMWGRKIKHIKRNCIPDFYGYFAAMCYQDDLYNHWMLKNKIVLGLCKDYFNGDTTLLIFHIFESLFRLYLYGFEDINIDKTRIQNIWCTIIKTYDTSSVFNIFYSKISIAPYKFLSDSYRYNTLDFSKKQLILTERDGEFVYKYYNYFNYFKESNNQLIKIFYDKVFITKIIYTLLSLKNSKYCYDNDIIFEIFLDYIKNNLHNLF